MNALEQFEKLYEEGRESNKEGRYHPAWQEYGQYARANADGAASIRQRQDYFSSRMVQFLGDSLVPKDPKRLFIDVEKRHIYWRDSAVCRVCHKKVDWHKAAFHHVTPHKAGGSTVVTNGALVHSHCHPISESAVSEFAKSFEPYSSV